MKGSIVVVDDKPDNLYLLQSLLTAHGYAVETAHHGAEALAIARLRKPALCITDLLMPVMDGYSLIRNWKADPRLQDVPIMVYTATYTDPDDERLANEMGADGFLVKPTEPEALLAAIQAVLKRHANIVTASNPIDEALMLEQYNAALVRKLEEKSIELETSNLLLREEARARQRLLTMRDAILDSLPAQVALIDHEGIVVAVNSSWEAFLAARGRLTPNMVVGGNYLVACRNLDVVLAEVGLSTLKGVEDVLAGRMPVFELEYPFPEEAGKPPMWIRIVITPIMHNDRTGAVISRFDVTDRRQVEEERRETAERLSLAVDAADIGIWELLDDGTLTWNRVMRDIYALPDDVVPTIKLWRSMADPIERQTADAAVRTLVKEGGRMERQFVMRCHDGVERHILGVAKALPAAGGTPGKLIGTNIDISERHRQAMALQAVNSRLETLVSQARIGIVVQREFKALLANDALAHIFGLPDRHAVLALPDYSQFFPLDQRLKIVDQFNALLADEPATDIVMMQGKRADGQPLDIEVRAFGIDWDGGRAVCAMITDVTGQRAVEAQLRQAQRLEAVGQLTGGVAHDFNNLLTVILGNAELLEEGLEQDPFKHRLAGMIVRAAERGADLARHLLAFSRRQRLEPGSVDINAMLCSLKDFLGRAVGPMVRLEVDLAPGLWSAMVDLAQLENALLNLAVNARDAMPGGGKLVITTHNVPMQDAHVDRPSDLAAGPQVMISVSDTGSGMDEATRLRAFEPFFTTKEVGKGSGLGLSMVYGFVKQSNGAVQIRSAPGKGTVVELWLPKSTIAPHQASARGDREPLPGGSEHVLVAEDDPMVRAQVVAQLEMLGYLVTSADNGMDALALLQEDTDFDLLFTDIVMPGGLNGHELVAEALVLRPSLPVLLTSGLADRAERPASSDLHRFSMLAKPYHREELALKVRDAIDSAARGIRTG
ncbi:signal transduction histidine kinase/CheY-like chemotaxis protein [Polymorphobacter multimanifer]|uniref:histidine kinase n=1 Tax=Polymorphobacter multimanifer TaxID=1070431 RepID=A0A841LC69_9SPHN|nr:response regulator [Polymorphobacter multimanifer]MBB6226742.1 signal transduction histidine kinase/CheY-like chemotaxis protein [Polymorphobacter multimanifer]